MNIEFSEHQLNKVLDFLSPKGKRGFPFEKLLQFLQVISIVGAACWTLYNYLKFDRDERALAAQIQTINRDQQALTLKQNELLATTQESLARITLKQQEFSFAQQQLLAASSQEKARLDVRALELENSIKNIQIANLNQAPLQFSTDLKLERVKDAGSQGELQSWRAQVHIAVKNISKKVVYINSGIIDAYYGEVTAEDGAPHVRRLNSPDETDGPIRWTKVQTTKYVSIERRRDIFEDGEMGPGWAVGGPAFGRFQENEGAEYTPKYQVFVKPHSMVGFIVTLVVEEENKKPWRWQWLLTSSTDLQQDIDTAGTPRLSSDAPESK